MNWGTKLLIGMGTFMVFILTLGAVMIFRNDRDALVDRDYYEKGQQFGRIMQEKQRAADDGVLPEIRQDGRALQIVFRGPARYRLTFRRAADASMDRRLTGTAHAHRISVPTDSLQSGPWSVRIEYDISGKTYLFEDEIMIP